MLLVIILYPTWLVIPTRERELNIFCSHVMMGVATHLSVIHTIPGTIRVQHKTVVVSRMTGDSRVDQHCIQMVPFLRALLKGITPFMEHYLWIRVTIGINFTNPIQPLFEYFLYKTRLIKKIRPLNYIPQCTINSTIVNWTWLVALPRVHNIINCYYGLLALLCLLKHRIQKTIN